MRSIPPGPRVVLKGLQHELPWYLGCVFVSAVLTIGGNYVGCGMFFGGFVLYMPVAFVRLAVSELPHPKAATLRGGFVAVALSLILGGCLLLAANGASIARIVVYVTGALTLQFVSAWLLTPAAIPEFAENATPLRF